MSTRIDRINDVRIFLRIVERGGLTAAGTSLSMSTPQVSKRLSALEKSLKVRLIDRSSRLLVLTDAGREFYPRAQAIVQSVREAEMAVAANSGELGGTLRISVPTALGEHGLVADFVALFMRNPNLSIEIHLSDRPVDVIEYGLDAALYLTDAPDRHPGDLILTTHPTSLAASPDYLNRAGRPSSENELDRHPTIRAVSERGQAAEWVLTHRDDGRRIVIPPSGRMFLSHDFRLLHAAALNGAGLARLPLGYILREAATHGLELLLPEWQFRSISVAAALRHKGARSNKVRVLLELIRTMLTRINMLAEMSPPPKSTSKQIDMP